MTQRTRVNSRGVVIPSNFGVTRRSESDYTCDGCGREFSAFSMRRSSGFALSTDSGRFYARNLGRAQAHADKCKGGEQ